MFFNYCNAICTALLAVSLQPRASWRECSGCSYQHLMTSGCYSVDAPMTVLVQGALRTSRMTLAAGLKGAGVQLRFFPILLLAKQMDEGRSKGMLQISTCYRAASTSKPLVTMIQRPTAGERHDLDEKVDWEPLCKQAFSGFRKALEQVLQGVKAKSQRKIEKAKVKERVHGKGGGFHSFLEKVRKQIHLSSLYTNATSKMHRRRGILKCSHRSGTIKIIQMSWDSFYDQSVSTDAESQGKTERIVNNMGVFFTKTNTLNTWRSDMEWEKNCSNFLGRCQ